MTTKEWLEAWDRGDTVWSVEMGGLGPGYEQAIQRLVVEMVRDSNCELPAPELDIDTWRDDTAHRCDAEPWGGFSGAQVGAAKTVAFRILRDGPDGVIQSLRDQGIHDRAIQINKRPV